MDTNVFISRECEKSFRDAIGNDDITRVKSLVKSGVGVNSIFECGTTPLILAIEQTRNEIAKYLIDEGANVNAVHDHKTPLILAVKNHKDEVLNHLLKSSKMSKKRNLSKDFCKKSKEVIEYLIDKGADVNIFYESKSLLHLAIDQSEDEIVRCLIDKGADVNVVCGNKSPLHLAICKGQTDIAKYLIDKGADVNRVCESRSPLYEAIYYHETELAKYLIDNDANINFTLENSTLTHSVSYNCSILSLAIRIREDEVVKYLIEKGVEVNSVISKRNLLCWAIVVKDNKFAKYLIDGGADVNSLGGVKAPLYAAIAYSNTELTKYLINNGADVNGIFNETRLLQVALEKNNRENAEYLLISGFDVNMKDGYQNVVADYLNTSGPFTIATDYSNRSDRFTIVTDTVKQHIVKLIAANFYMCEKNKMAVADKKYDSLRDSCTKEVELMKQSSLTGSALTYYDLLRKPLHKSALKLKFLFKNNSEAKYTSSLSNILSGISSYKNIIQYRLDRALERAKLLVQVDEFVVNISHDLLLDPEVVRQVLQYLTNRELKSLHNSS